MKTAEVNIPEFKENDFFFAIRKKNDYIRLILNAAELLLLNNPSEGASSLKLIVNKMSRIFIYKEDKYVSVSFPFRVYFDDGKIDSIYSLEGREINFKTIAMVSSILNDPYFMENTSITEFSDSGAEDEFEQIVLNEGVEIFDELIQSEPAYIRYDNDPEREDGLVHPLHHVDINYSSYGCYKLGCFEGLQNAVFEDILDIRTDCKFIGDA